MKWIQDIFTQYMPPEWEFSSGVKTTAINMYILTILLIVAAGWGIGISVLCCMLLIDYIGILINRYRYAKVEKEFKNYIMSGLTPCLVYSKSDPWAIRHVLVIDDKLSTAFAYVYGECVVFYPIIVFLSKQSQTDFSKKSFDSYTKVKEFYNEKIVQLPSCVPTEKNLAVIKIVLEYQKDVKEADLIS